MKVISVTNYFVHVCMMENLNIEQFGGIFHWNIKFINVVYIVMYFKSKFCHKALIKIA